MSGTRAIVDTNLVLYVLQGDRSAADLLADRDIILSYITCMELLAEPAQFITSTGRKGTRISTELASPSVVDHASQS